jgi:uncharacterized protein (TIGR02466 family)
MSRDNPDLPKSQSSSPKADASERFLRRDLFPTIIFEYDVEDCRSLNETLVDLTYAERGRGTAPNKSSTVKLGSWHSATNLHKNPAYEPLLTEVNAALGRISEDLHYARDQILKVTSMWSIITPPRYSSRAHVHPNSLWSGCYYVQAPEGAGRIKFVDPRTVVLMKEPKYEQNEEPRECWTKLNFKAIPGRMVIFPAWLYQSVETNLAKENGNAGDCIVIAFNINQVSKK